MPSELNARHTQLDVTQLSTVSAAVSARLKELAGLPRALDLGPTDIAPPPKAGPPEPGVEHWSIKTGGDEEAEEVGSNPFEGIGETGIVDTTVEELAALLRPTDMLPIDRNHRRDRVRRARPVELFFWRLVADVIVVKKEDDGDLHLVLQGESDETCIAEAPIPRPPFVEIENTWLSAMKDVGEKIAQKFGPHFTGVPLIRFGKFLMPPTSVDTWKLVGPALVIATGIDLFDLAQPFRAKVSPTPAEVVGVGFFDRLHGQTGVSLANGIELHPILSIEWG